jgi:phosphoglycerol transferase MdoB-like AlkP superfamily enzyme
MKFKLLPLSGKAVWQNNKPFIWFLLSLLLIHSVLKIIFYQYNQSLLFTGADKALTALGRLRMFKWSLVADLLTLLAINAGLLFVLTAVHLFSKKTAAWVIVPVFVVLNSFAVILNLADIFYFPFHFQRANADLLYVVDHSFNRLMHQNFFMLIVSALGVVSITWLMWFLHRKINRSFQSGNNCRLATALLFAGAGLCFMFKNTLGKILLPTYPLIELKSNQLIVIQNSFHTFIYSVFRNGSGLQVNNYMTTAACDSIFPIRKTLNTDKNAGPKPNIVLFIMESVPYDFFDSSSAYKVNMPFFDSLLQKSTFFNNAFCFGHESNKGITAILAGIPTLTDIPIYHSPYVNMPFTPIGSALKKLQYKSLFCIGDEYDNFGFAKCMNWLGIDRYYSKEDIPGYKNIPAHSMGLQDEYVLDFFYQKIRQQHSPFFAIQYNISTHYPYDIPEIFAKKTPANYTVAMKAMQYYDYRLQQFFNHAKNEPWFANTKFIFCSDHWLFPQGKPGTYAAVSGFRIPVIIYDPSVNKKQVDNRLASQFDILPTILAAAGYSGPVISYGNNLSDNSSISKYVFSKSTSNVYQVTDSSFVMGFNMANNKAEYLYNYKADIELKKNLAGDKNYAAVLKTLTIRVKAFLQKTVSNYNSKPFK